MKRVNLQAKWGKARAAAPVGHTFVGFVAILQAIGAAIPLEHRASIHLSHDTIRQIGSMTATIFGATAALCAHRAWSTRNRMAGVMTLILLGPGAVWSWLTFVMLASAALAITLLVRGLRQAHWAEVYCGLGLIALECAAGSLLAQPGLAAANLAVAVLAASGAMTCLYGALVQIEVTERQTEHDLYEVRRRHRHQIELTEDLLHDLRSGLLSIEAAIVALDPALVEPVRLEAVRLRRLAAPGATQPPGPFEVVAPLRDLVALRRAAGLDVTLVAPTTAWAHGRQQEAVCAVDNLLTNAERHGCSPVLVEVAEVGADLTVSVSDSGPGLPSGSKERLFNRCTTTHPMGQGLGLCRARTLARNNGGELIVMEVPGSRTEFVLRLAPASIRQAVKTSTGSA
jgi:signal transduction histidine kinase